MDTITARRAGRRFAAARRLQDARRCCGEHGSALSGLSSGQQAQVSRALERAAACAAWPLPAELARRLSRRPPAASDDRRAQLETCLAAAADALSAAGSRPVSARVTLELLEVMAILEAHRTVTR